MTTFEATNIVHEAQLDSTMSTLSCHSCTIDHAVLTALDPGYFGHTVLCSDFAQIFVEPGFSVLTVSVLDSLLLQHKQCVHMSHH